MDMELNPYNSRLVQSGNCTVPRMEIFEAINLERERQDRLKAQGRFKFTAADGGMGNLDRLACIGEEIGEVARECLNLRNLVYDRPRHQNDTETDDLEKELIQIAALVVAWLESPMNSMPRMDNGKDSW